MDYKSEIAKMLSGLAGMSEDEVCLSVEIPANTALGDFAFPCHRLAKSLKKAPNVIAADMAAGIKLSPVFDRAEAAGPYLNFFVNKETFAENIISKVLEKGLNYGGGDDGAGKTVVIDYSSPNVTHEFHIGHLFSTTIGAALYRFYKFLGYRTIGVNYLGDWGTQFGKLLYGYNSWSSAEQLEKGGADELTRVYVKYHDEAVRDPGLEKAAREWLLKIEAGDACARELWWKFRNIYLDKMEETYKRMDISFDSYRGESYYNDKMDAVADELREKNLLVESDGAQIVELEQYKMPVCLILRSDGGTLYPTRDIAAALDRMREYGFYKSLYVTDMRQNLHFAQFFKVLELMGYEWAKDLVHIPYGLLSLESGALSARKGNVVLLEDLFDESAKRILDIINEKNADLPDKESVAEDVGVGAIVFGVLYTSRIKDLVFSWEKALNFDGETGPYVQYTHARASSVLVKSEMLEDGLEKADYGSLTDDESFELIKAIGAFPDKLREAADKYEPFILSRSLVSVAQAFNKFYHENPILHSKGTVRAARLELVKCTRDVLKTGLGLLGIKAPEKM
ncbi:MAG: arginine--tRNA ligase [Defluviitaleaceae bacterium]|nr:arginine--tRNA ligase [Defluviitaleaceae bacterium]MCL2835946.1 arginine--tRNA ligase [Defluviitaleaceae bacterium]